MEVAVISTGQESAGQEKKGPSSCSSRRRSPPPAARVSTARFRRTGSDAAEFGFSTSATMVWIPHEEPFVSVRRAAVDPRPTLYSRPPSQVPPPSFVPVAPANRSVAAPAAVVGLDRLVFAAGHHVGIKRSVMCWTMRCLSSARDCNCLWSRAIMGASLRGWWLVELVRNSIW